MMAHLQAEYPLEGCGLLAGNGRFSTQIYCIDNILRSPVAYEMDPQQQINAMLEFEERGRNDARHFSFSPHRATNSL